MLIILFFLFYFILFFEKEALDRAVWRTSFGSGCGLVIQTAG
jgi:hypothetical protein